MYTVSPAQFLNLIAENTGDIVAVYSPEWKCEIISPSCTNILGYTPKELNGTSIYQFIHFEDLNRLLDETKVFSKKNLLQYLTYRTKRKDGIYIWVETSIKKFEEGFIVVTRDITTRKNSEEMVKKFVEGVQYASDCIVMANPEGQIMYVNPAIETITGFKPEEVIGKHANIIWGGQNDKNEVLVMWNTLQLEKRPVVVDVLNTDKSGRTFFTDVRIAPIFDQNKQIVFYVGISRDVTKAKEVDRMKNEFISLASHQLRTPLTAIKWRLEMLGKKDGEGLNILQRTYINEINQANERMIDLVNSLLNISRIESGRLIVEPKITSLEDLMLSAIEDLESRIKEKQIQVRLSFQTNIYDVSVDPRLVRNVYSNILSNAVKYTPDKGKIEIAIYIEGDNIVTKISDSGYGIPKDEQHRIFEKFFRGENIRKVETEGTGLGLYLVKTIIDALKGKVWFESIENKGTTFWVSFDVHGTKAKKGEVTLTQ